MPDTKTRFSRKKDAVFQEVEGAIHILDEKQDAIVSLNETASLLWKKLSKKVTTGDLVSTLTDSFDVDATGARRDVDDFIRSMSKLGLISKKQ